MNLVNALSTALLVSKVTASTVEVTTDGTVRVDTDSPDPNKSFKVPDESSNLKEYLNPEIFNDPDTVEQITEGLRNGEAVVIRNAFLPEFAEAMYDELVAAKDDFALWTVYDDDSDFSCHHHNIYDLDKYTPLMNATMDMMNSDASLAFAQELTGRECSGATFPSASYYKPGDHSLPHSDFHAERTVAYVWHLTKNWKTGWGGHLYWANEHYANSMLPPSFNTLTLFWVTPLSAHMVSTVTPMAKAPRLAINGWWRDEWEPTFEPDVESNYPHFEDYFNQEERLLELTETQMSQVEELASVCQSGKQPEWVSEDRCESIIALSEAASELAAPEEYQSVLVLGS